MVKTFAVPWFVVARMLDSSSQTAISTQMHSPPSPLRVPLQAAPVLNLPLCQVLTVIVTSLATMNLPSQKMMIGIALVTTSIVTYGRAEARHDDTGTLSTEENPENIAKSQ